MSERTCAASYFNPRTEDSTSGPLVRNLKVKQRTRRTKKTIGFSLKDNLRV